MCRENDQLRKFPIAFQSHINHFLETLFEKLQSHICDWWLIKLWPVIFHHLQKWMEQILSVGPYHFSFECNLFDFRKYSTRELNKIKLSLRFLLTISRLPQASHILTKFFFRTILKSKRGCTYIWPINFRYHQTVQPKLLWREDFQLSCINWSE